MNWKFNFRDVSTPKPGLVVYGPSYWMCENGDPKKALFYGTTPQANSNKELAERYIDKDMYTDFSNNLQVIYLEVAFVPNRN